VRVIKNEVGGGRGVVKVAYRASPLPSPQKYNIHTYRNLPIRCCCCCCYLKVFFGGGQSINTRAACEKRGTGGETERDIVECRWRKGISRERERECREKGACAYDSNAGFERTFFQVLITKQVHRSLN